MNEIRENDVVALVTPRPEMGLQRGDVGNVIQVFQQTTEHPAGFIVEFVDETGAVRAETDIVDASEIVKLRLNPKGSLEEWLGSFSFLVIVFTDIIGSTALSNELGDEHWLDLLNTHFKNARRIANACEGYEIKVIGDSYMVAFRNAEKALEFAIAFEKDPGDQRVNIRAGVHAGTARIIDDDILGLDNDIFGIMINYTPWVKRRASYSSWLMLSNAAKKCLEGELSRRYEWLNFIPDEVRLQDSPESWRVWVASLQRRLS